MSWQTDLLARLKADSTLSTLTGDRISWFEAARSWGDTYPQIVLQEVSPGREYTHSGPDGLDRPRVQFDIRASAGVSTFVVEQALSDVMETDGVTVGDTLFHMGFLQLRRTKDTDDLADQARVQAIQMDFIFHHEAV